MKGGLKPSTIPSRHRPARRTEADLSTRIAQLEAALREVAAAPTLEDAAAAAGAALGPTS